MLAAEEYLVVRRSSFRAGREARETCIMMKYPHTPLWVCIALLALSGPALAIVDGIENDDLFHTPGSAWYGMNWDHVYMTRGGTSSAVGYFTLLTARHYAIDDTWDDNNPPDTFLINGDTFQVVSTTNLPATSSGTPDLRLVTVENLTEPARPLPGFYSLYDPPSQPFGYDKNFVLVGTGYSGETNLDYYTEDRDTGRAKRWGTNKHNRIETVSADSYTTDCIRMPFDTFGWPYESGYANGDSGGPVFVKPYNQDDWLLAGVNLYREDYGSDPNDFDTVYAASMPTYAASINDFLAGDWLPGDTDLNGDVDYEDYLTVKGHLGETTGMTWREGDFDGDGDVDRDDYRAVVINYNYDGSGHPAMYFPESTGSDGPLPTGGVPEPCALALLAAGAAALLRRRPPRR